MRPTWPQVTLYLGVVIVVGVLALYHVDTTALIGLIVALLLGGTLGTLNHVKDNTNGQLSGLVDLVREQSRQLARSAPPADDKEESSNAV